MILPRPALIALFGSLLGTVIPGGASCAAQTLPRLGLSGPEVGMDLSAKPLRGRHWEQPGADAVIRQPRGPGRSRTLALGEAEAIGDGADTATGEGGWPVDLRRWAPPPRSAQAEP